MAGATEMKQLKLEFVPLSDAVVERLKTTPGNLFDPSILGYPTLQVLSAYNGNGSVAYLPIQRCLFLESLAVNQDSELMERAQAFRDLVKGSTLIASSHGIKEIYMLCEDENVLKVAEGHGFERIDYPLVRMKL